MSQWTPYFDYTHPPDERRAKEHVWRQIHLLRFHTSNFGHAVNLLHHCEELSQELWEEAQELGPDAFGEQMRAAMNWKRVAARDAVLTVYHFGVTLGALKSNVGKVPSLKGVDHKRLKLAWKRFEGGFPMYEEHRHAVAHLADDMSTADKAAALVPDDGQMAAGQLRGRTFGFRYRNRAMSLTIDEANYEKLVSIRTDAWEAFRPIEGAELAAAAQRSRDRTARRSQDGHQNRTGQGER